MRNVMMMMGLITVFSVGILRSSEAADPHDRMHGYGLGRLATDLDIQPWNIDVAPTGEGLPLGHGTAKQGAAIFAAMCASCHGPTGQEGPMDRLVGGAGTLGSQKPVKTVGSYWPYATTLYDYVYRAMPFSAPQSLSSDEVYSVVAWLLYQNSIITEDTVIDAHSLPGIRMPNHTGFLPDPRPDVPRN
ncbi:MAG: cytochrome c [Nitrospirota bacterium]